MEGIEKQEIREKAKRIDGARSRQSCGTQNIQIVDFLLRSCSDSPTLCVVRNRGKQATALVGRKKLGIVQSIKRATSREDHDRYDNRSG
jgi:hypothetical protein